jgi:hypothetical protein
VEPIVIWIVTGIVVPTLVAVAFTLAGMTPPAFSGARVCFWSSGISLYSAGVLWLWLTPRSDASSAVAVVAAIVAGIGLMTCLRWLAQRQAEFDRQSHRGCERQWSVGFNGRVADIQILADTLARFAVAENVTIINRGETAVCLSAQLGVQWAHEMMHTIDDARQIPAPEWDSTVVAFGFEPREQLLFPLTVGPGATARGHIVFEIPTEGTGVAMLSVVDRIGGLRHESEGTNYARQYYLRIFNEAVFGQESYTEVHVYAPQLDGSGISMATDLAVAGSPAVWNPRSRQFLPG